jgi:hypothetical protein
MTCPTRSGHTDSRSDSVCNSMGQVVGSMPGTTKVLMQRLHRAACHCITYLAADRETHAP